MKNKKTRIMIIVIVILTAAIVLSFVYMHNHQDSNTAEKETDPPAAAEISIKSYESYYPDNVDFAYVTAVIQAETDEPVSLAHFTTDEGINLDETADYMALLKSQGTDLSTAGFTDELTNGTNLIFIPVKDSDASEVKVTNDLQGVKTLTFILNKETEEPESSSEPSSTPDEQEEGSEDVTVAKQDDIEAAVSRIFEIDPAVCLQNGEMAMLPSSARVFAAEIEVRSLDRDSITIVSADYTTADGQTFTAEDSSFSDQEYTTAIGTELHKGDKACVYFILLGNGETEFNYTGTLQLQLADGTVIKAAAALS